MPNSEKDYTIRIRVPSCGEGQRIDKFLAATAEINLSRTQIKHLILNGCITVNAEAVKPHYLVSTGDTIVILAVKGKPQSDLAAVPLPLDILYEDQQVIAVNKPAGLVVHPAAGHASDTLVNALLFHCRLLARGSSPEKPGIVHRLDKDTSGVLLAAKDDYAFRQLSHQFRQRLVHKVYCAIVAGEVDFDEGVIDAPLGRSPLHRKQMRVMYDSPRQALTRYKVISRSRRFSVLEVCPHTGRTHQIRVHLASIGHPVLGDALYGRNRGPQDLITRQALHALRLRVEHPLQKTPLVLEAPLPDDMRRVIALQGS